MTSKPIIIAASEILGKYLASGIDDRLHLYDQIQCPMQEWQENPNSGAKTCRKTEVYKDKNTGNMVLVRHYITNSKGTTTMTVTLLVIDGLVYHADRL